MKTITVNPWNCPDIYSYEDTQNYMREMHKQGWRLKRTNRLGLYVFEECAPEDVVYQIDCNPDGKISNQEYMQMFADCGWEYVFSAGKFHFFRKPANQTSGDEGIFCDRESLSRMKNRVSLSRVCSILVYTVSFLLCWMILDPIFGFSQTLDESAKKWVSIVSIAAIIIGTSIGILIRKKWINKRPVKAVVPSKASMMIYPLLIIISSSALIIAAIAYIVPAVTDFSKVVSIEYIDDTNAEPLSMEIIGKSFAKKLPGAKIYYESYKAETGSDITLEEFCSKFADDDAQNYTYGNSLYYNGDSTDARSFYDYNIKINFSNGKALNKSAYLSAVSGIYSVHTIMYITHEAYADALERNDGYIYATVLITQSYDNRFFKSNKKTDQSVMVKIPVTNSTVVDNYIESMEIVSYPQTDCAVNEHIDIIGTEIRYKLHGAEEKVSKIREGNFIGKNYQLDSAEITCSRKIVNDSFGKPLKYVYTLYYYDGSASFDVNITANSIFDKIVITDYKYSETTSFAEVTYEITYKDGTRESFTGSSFLEGSPRVLSTVRGYVVYIDTKPYGYKDYTPEKNMACLSVNIGDVNYYVEFKKPTLQ